MSKEKDSKRESTESIAEQIANGEIDFRKALRIWLNKQPLKRGWYITIILFLLSAGVLLYHFLTSKIESLSRERDKYFQALQPWQAMAAGIFPNQPPEKQLAMLRQDLVSISNALNFAIPNLPYIKIETLNGLPIDGLPNGGTNAQHLKLHRLEIRNFCEVEIDNLRTRLQIPEPIISTKEINQSVGTSVGWRPLKIEILSTGKSGRTSGGLWQAGGAANYFLYPVEAFNPYVQLPEGKNHRGQQFQIAGSGDVTGVWELTIDKLPPSGYVSLLFFTSDSDDVTNYTQFALKPLWTMPPNPSTIADTNELRFSLEGEYQFQAVNKPHKQYFLVPISFDVKSRAMSSAGIQTNIGHWHPVILESY